MQAARRIFGVTLSPLGREALAEAMTREAVPPGGGVRLTVTMNLDHVVRLQKDAAFRAAYDRASTVTVDGKPILAYARLRGAETSGRLTGADLLIALAERFRPGVHRPYFVISSPETGEALRAWFVARGFAPADVGYTAPSFGFERDAAASSALAAAIRAHGTTHLVMGVGAPKSEVWVDRHRSELGDLYAYGFGSGPDFMVGRAARAPQLVQALGFEWLWRVAHDPKRLWKRYFVDSWAVIPAVARDLRRA